MSEVFGVEAPQDPFKTIRVIKCKNKEEVQQKINSIIPNEYEEIIRDLDDYVSNK